MPLMHPGRTPFRRSLVGLGWRAGRLRRLELVGEVAARAYLITAEQFVDVLAQEMRLEPGLELDLAPVRETGWHSSVRAATRPLAHLGIRDDLPMLTFTSADVGPSGQPAERGLPAHHRASACVSPMAGRAPQIGGYLARFPGAAGVWSPASIEELAA